MGDSLAFRRPVSEVLGDALVNSLKLGILAFIIVVPLSILGGVYAALQRGLQARPRHLARRPVRHRDPRLRLGRAADPRLQPRPRDLPRDGHRAARLGLHRPDLLPDPARDLPRVRALRLHRPDGAGRDGRGARRRLHAHGDHQGPAAAHRRARPRAAQLAAADDRRGRHAGGLPARRPAGHRDDLQLPGDRADAVPRRGPEGLPAAADRRARSWASSTSSPRCWPTSRTPS